jgi:hypothetical protein
MKKSQVFASISGGAMIGPDGTILSLDDGRTLFFPINRFVSEIVQEKACLICGAKAGSRVFNDEHILPKWLLKRFGLASRRITLPNLAQFKYGSYVLPCCEACNTLYSTKVETPMSRLFAGSYEDTQKILEDDQQWVMLFVWMAFIFIKTHLKDRTFNVTLDRSKGDPTKIADQYEFEALHHVHCLARIPFSKPHITWPLIGTMLIFPTQNQADDVKFEAFDFCDLLDAKAIMLRIGEVAVIAILNDSGSALQMMGPTLSRIEGPLSPIQLRELFARTAYAALKRKYHPSFSSGIDKDGYCIKTKPPKSPELEEWEPGLFGALIWRSVRDLLGPGQRSDLEAAILRGEKTFLFDDSGKFIKSPFAQEKNTQ